MSFDARSWYQRNYKDQAWVDDTDPDCWHVLEAFPTNLYNLLDRELPGGGLAKLPGSERGRGAGLRLWLRRDLATVDMDEITRLTIAAHRYLVRVNIGTADLRTYLKNPLDFESGYAEVFKHGDLLPWDILWAGCAATVTMTRWRWMRTTSGTDFHVDCLPPGTTAQLHSFPRTATEHMVCGACSRPITGFDEERTCGMQLVRATPDDPWVHEGDEDDISHLSPHTPEPTEPEVFTINGLLEIMLTPRIARVPGKTSGMVDHPTLDHLVDRIRRTQGQRRPTRTQNLLEGARRR